MIYGFQSMVHSSPVSYICPLAVFTFKQFPVKKTWQFTQFLDNTDRYPEKSCSSVSAFTLKCTISTAIEDDTEITIRNGNIRLNKAYRTL